MGRCGTGDCGQGQCGSCDGNSYPVVASAFSAVPDNYNNVTNSVQRYAVFSSLRVAGKAVQNTACGDKHCAETKGEDLYTTDCCEAVESFGFLGLPQRLRTSEVAVCGDAKCAKDSRKGDKRAGQDCGSCGDVQCGPGLLGFVEFPKAGYFRDVRTCGPIRTNVACKKHDRTDCTKCQVVLDCGLGCDAVVTAATAAAKARDVRASQSESRSRRRGGCGCN